MLKMDFHVHTCFCDGTDQPEKIVEEACRRGFTDLGFSGHADYDFCVPGLGMSDVVLDRYKRKLYRLREKYAGKINLYIGLELDCLGPRQTAEYTIGSTHCIRKNGEYISVDHSENDLVDAVTRLWKGDWYALVRDYYELEASVYDRTGCDWIGHFDLITKFNEGYRYFDETRDDYLEPALEAMKKLNKAELPFEINTGAIFRGFRKEPYPSRRLLKELNQMGGRIMINSDSHSASALGFHFDQAEKLAAECGFRKVTVLKPGGGFREIELC